MQFSKNSYIIKLPGKMMLAPHLYAVNFTVALEISTVNEPGTTKYYLTPAKICRTNPFPLKSTAI